MCRLACIKIRCSCLLCKHCSITVMVSIAPGRYQKMRSWMTLVHSQLCKKKRQTFFFVSLRYFAFLICQAKCFTGSAWCSNSKMLRHIYKHKWTSWYFKTFLERQLCEEIETVRHITTKKQDSKTHENKFCKIYGS